MAGVIQVKLLIQMRRLLPNNVKVRGSDILRARKISKGAYSIYGTGRASAIVKVLRCRERM